jgi:hypothetical protein
MDGGDRAEADGGGCANAGIPRGARDCTGVDSAGAEVLLSAPVRLGERGARSSDGMACVWRAMGVSLGAGGLATESQRRRRVWELPENSGLAVSM